MVPVGGLLLALMPSAIPNFLFSKNKCIPAAFNSKEKQTLNLIETTYTLNFGYKLIKTILTAVLIYIKNIVKNWKPLKLFKNDILLIKNSNLMLEKRAIKIDAPAWGT